MSNRPLIQRGQKTFLSRLLENIFRKQPIVPVEDKNFAKVLTVIDIVAYGISATVGSGIFVATGRAAKQAGPGVIFSYILAGLASFFSALSYGEFATRFPVSGSAYTFSYIGLGEIIAWIIGWCLTLEYAISASATARSWSASLVYALNSFGLNCPEWLDGYQVSIFSFSPLSVVIIALCTLILIFGAKESNIFNIVMSCFNVGIILFIIVLGSIYVQPENWQPFLPNGFQGVFAAAGTVFFAYIGFDSVTTLAAEAKNPKRDMPIGIIGTLTIATSLYIGASMVVTGMVNWRFLDYKAPLAMAFAYVGVGWAQFVVAIGSITTLTATTLTTLMGQPRIFFKIAEDGLLFQSFLKLSSKKIPIVGTLATAILASFLAVLFDLDYLTDMISIGTLLAFTVVCGGILSIRYRVEEESVESEYSNDEESEEIPIITYGRFEKVENIARFANKYTSLIICAWFILTFVFALLMRNGVFIGYTSILFPFFIACIFLMAILKPQNLPQSFTCPLVPFFPLLGMFVNTYLLAQKDLLGGLYFLGWLVLGIVIYFVYGLRHSKLRKLYEEKQNKVKLLSSQGEDDNAIIND